MQLGVSGFEVFSSLSLRKLQASHLCKQLSIVHIFLPFTLIFMRTLTLEILYCILHTTHRRSKDVHKFLTRAKNQIFRINSITQNKYSQLFFNKTAQIFFYIKKKTNFRRNRQKWAKIFYSVLKSTIEILTKCKYLR